MTPNVGRFGEIRGARFASVSAGRLFQHSQVCSTPSGSRAKARPSSRATKQREERRLADAVGDDARRDAWPRGGVSVEAAEVASLGEADFGRSLVPSEPARGGEDSAPTGAMGRVAAAFVSGDTRS